MKKLQPSRLFGQRWAVCCLTLTTLLLGIGWWTLRSYAGAPAARLADSWHRQQTVTDRHGNVLRALASPTGVRGTPLGLSDMGERLVTATLYSEDRRFFEHAGIDYSALLRALGQNLSEARIVSGASTISQQLVKLLDHRGQEHRRSLWRKLTESARAQNLEQHLTKTEILTAYLNRLNYGRGLVGPERAARAFFNKPTKDLSWAEASLLAVLPRAPSFLDPYKHASRAQTRQRALLATLADHAVISKEELDSALGTQLDLAPVVHDFEAPHWVDRLIDEQRLKEPGETRTTLDLELQRDAESILEAYRPRLAQQAADNAAAIIIDNDTGEVLAYLGSFDYHSGYAAQVDHVRSPRQAGSTLKPFVYALAFAHGTRAHQPLADVSKSFGSQSDAYAPDNFDHVFHGPVSAHTALASSLNIPAVGLAASLREGTLLRSLRRLGLNSLHEDSQHYGLSLALGSGEVSLAELSIAYAILARQGMSLVARSVVKQPRELGRPQVGEQTLDRDAASQVTLSLSDPLARVLGLGGRGPYSLKFPVAVKTGTSSGYRDAWSVGYTRERTVGVWVGNSSGAPTKQLTGAAGAGPIFVELMERAMRDRTPSALLPAESVEELMLCPLSGLPVQDACPDAVARRVAKGYTDRYRDQQCPLHRHATRSSDGSYACSKGGARVVALSDEYAGWLEAQPAGAPGRDAEGLPWLLDSATSGCAESHEPRISIEYPTAGSVLVTSASGRPVVAVDAKAHAVGLPDDTALEFVLDGEPIARGTAPYRQAIHVGRGDHELLVRPADPRSVAKLGRVVFSVR